MGYLKGILFAALLTLTACTSLSGLSTSRSEIAALHQGMTEREVVNEIGRPIDINRSRGEYGTTAQFVYSLPGSYERAYVYFDDGRLTSVQY